MIPIPPTFSLPELTQYQRTLFFRYAKKVLEAQHEIASLKGRNIVNYTLGRNKKHQHMEHYPKGDRIDYETGAQYFYHCHRENYDTEEHGHFHCFLRYEHISKRVHPAPLSDWDKYIDNPMTHLVAIGMNRYGQPIRLFSINRWISEEILYDAKDTRGLLKQFKMTKKDSKYWQILDQWVEGMLHLFSPQIAWLNVERDRAIRHYQAVYPESNIYDDHRLDILSEIPIDLTKQIQWVLESDYVPQ